MKLFHTSTDERVRTEVSRVYKIGYYILSFGIFIDLLLQLTGVQFGVDGAQVTFRPVELLVFIAAQIACAVLMARRGLMDDNGFAEAETFPLKHYVLVGLAAGAVAAAIVSVANFRNSAAWSGFDRGTLFAAIAIQFLVMVPFTAALIVLAYYAAFRAAKKRRALQMAMDGEAGEK